MEFNSIEKEKRHKGKLKFNFLAPNLGKLQITFTNWAGTRKELHYHLLLGNFFCFLLASRQNCKKGLDKIKKKKEKEKRSRLQWCKRLWRFDKSLFNNLCLIGMNRLLALTAHQCLLRPL